MKKGLTELVFILDRSGSMSGLESDTIGGFNSMIHKQLKTEGKANITTVLFDDRVEILHDREPIENVKDMDHTQYYVRGCTALLDAVGTTISKMGNVQKKLDNKLKAEKVIFVITTDGYENSSREYTYAGLKRIIERQKEKYEWEFVFLGANMDAVKEAEKFGISADRSATYINDKKGVQMSYGVVSDFVCKCRASDERINESWKKDIVEDTEKRG
ncbi:MAG: VWA domain-containing protein [Peptostreptococcaceae bacterium]|nr:VWA domain-containing protein [Peptostreptococcaceae bacterium]